MADHPLLSSSRRYGLLLLATLASLGVQGIAQPSGLQQVVVTALAYMLLSSLAMGVADLLGIWRPRGGSVRGTIASSVLPAVALVAIAV